MTTNYGVTLYGARQQIGRQLRDIEQFPRESVSEASSYLAQKTFYSLRELFRETRRIQVPWLLFVVVLFFFFHLKVRLLLLDMVCNMSIESPYPLNGCKHIPLKSFDNWKIHSSILFIHFV